MEYIDFVKKDEYKDHFSNLSNRSESMLITENNGFEVIRMFIPKGSKGVMPPLEKDVTEVYYIIDGSLSFYYKNKEECLHQGDTFILRAYSKAIPYHVLEDITMIFSTNHLEFSKHKKILDLLNNHLDLLQETDLKTRDHCQRIEPLVTYIARQLHMDTEKVENLTYATRFHDVGKIKNGRMNIISEHPLYGSQIVLDYLGEDVANIILQHHEKIDGTGYPYGLKGDKIKLEAQILSIANCYDHLLYNEHLTKEEAIDEINRRRNTDFDKYVVDAFLATLKGI